MIPFDKIDERLEKLGRKRKWLAEVTGRSDHAIRAALAPNAAPKSRSTLLQKALTDAIEREEAEQEKKPDFQKVIPLEPTVEEYKLWSRAFHESKGFDTIEDWAKAALNKASGALHVIESQMVAEDPAPYGAKTVRK